MDSVNKCTYNNTFTVYVYDQYYNIVAEQTTYAGWHKINIPNSITSTYGETYISIKCVDDRGVGSHL